MARKLQSLINSALSSIYPTLEAMTDSELRNVRSAKQKLTNTNCWWLAYECRGALSEIAEGMLRTRYEERRKAKAAAKKAALGTQETTGTAK